MFVLGKIGHGLVCVGCGNEFPSDDMEACHYPVLVGHGLTRLHQIVITDLKQYKGMPVRWTPPLYQVLLGVAPQSAKIVAEQVGREDDLDVLAAKQCFYDINKEVLVKYAGLIDLALPRGVTLYTVCKLLVMRCLGIGEGVELSRILGKRRFRKDNRTELWQHVPAAGLLDKQDAKEMEQILVQQEAEHKEHREYHKSLGVLNKKVYPRFSNWMAAAANNPKARCDQAKKAIDHSPYSNYFGRLVPLTDSITQEQATDITAPGYYVYKHEELARRLCRHQYSTDSRSAAWAHYGFKESLMMVLRWAWFRCMQDNGYDPLDCPVAGLLPKRSGDLAIDADNLEELRVNLEL